MFEFIANLVFLSILLVAGLAFWCVGLVTNRNSLWGSACCVFWSAPSGMSP